MKTKTYSKTKTAHLVQVTSENILEVADWCGGKVEQTAVRPAMYQLSVPTLSGVAKARLSTSPKHRRGDYVGRDEDGCFVVYPQYEIENHWEEV